MNEFENSPWAPGAEIDEPEIAETTETSFVAAPESEPAPQLASSAAFVTTELPSTDFANATTDPGITGFATPDQGVESADFAVVTTEKPKPKSIGMVGVLGGGAFAYMQLAGNVSENTPEQAVEAMLQSMAKGDAIGMARALTPGERDVILDSAVPLFGELNRLDLLGKGGGVDLNKVGDLQTKLEGFTASSTLLRDDLASVKINSGRLTGKADFSKLLPGGIGTFFYGNSEDRPTDEPVDLDLSTDKDATTGPVVQKVGSRWYFSLNYTAAEAARHDTENPMPVPTRGAGIAPTGADSPEAAVLAMFNAGAEVDPRKAISLLPPDEFGALQEYGDLYIAKLERDGADFRQRVQMTVDPKLVSEKISDDRSLVVVNDLPFTLKGNFDGTLVEASNGNGVLRGSASNEGEVISYELKNGCITMTVGKVVDKACDGNEFLSSGDAMFNPFAGMLDIPFVTSKVRECGVDPKSQRFVIVTVKRGDKWFVSPLRTMMDGTTQRLRGFTKTSLQCVKDKFSAEAKRKAQQQEGFERETLAPITQTIPTRIEGTPTPPTPPTAPVEAPSSSGADIFMASTLPVASAVPPPQASVSPIPGNSTLPIPGGSIANAVAAESIPTTTLSREPGLVSEPATSAVPVVAAVEPTPTVGTVPSF
jgi:hypothetical protein